MSTYKDMRLKHVNYVLAVAEEIELFLGLKTQVVFKDASDDMEIPDIVVDTIAGNMKFEPFNKEITQDVFWFVFRYGHTIAEYGRKESLKIRDKK